MVFVFFLDGKAEPESGCKSGTWIGSLVAVIVGLLLIIFALAWKTCSNNKGGKKQEKSLWVEEHPLSGKPTLD